MRRPDPIPLLCCVLAASWFFGAPALATPAPCAFGGVVEVFPDAHPDRGCQVHLVVQRGDLVSSSLELSISPTPSLDFSTIQLKSSAGVHTFTVQKLAQLGANFSTRRTDCDCTPEYGWYLFDHYLLVPEQRLPSSAVIAVQGLPSTAQLPEYAYGSSWGFTTTAATQGPSCAQLGALQAGQGPLCGTCDLCSGPGYDTGPAPGGGSDSGAAGGDQGSSMDDQGSTGGDAAASSSSSSSGGSAGCTLAAGAPRLPSTLLVLVVLGLLGLRRRARGRGGRRR